MFFKVREELTYHRMQSVASNTSTEEGKRQRTFSGTSTVSHNRSEKKLIFTPFLTLSLYHYCRSLRTQSSIEEEPTSEEPKSPLSNGHNTSVEEKEEKEEKPQTVGDASSKGAKLIEKETAETGSVGWGVYAYYMRNMGFLGVMVSVLTQIFCQVNLELKWL